MKKLSGSLWSSAAVGYGVSLLRRSGEAVRASRCGGCQWNDGTHNDPASVRRYSLAVDLSVSLGLSSRAVEALLGDYYSGG